MNFNSSKIIFTSEKNTATAQTWPGETDTTPGNDIY